MWNIPFSKRSFVYFENRWRRSLAFFSVSNRQESFSPALVATLPSHTQLPSYCYRIALWEDRVDIIHPS